MRSRGKLELALCIWSGLLSASSASADITYTYKSHSLELNGAKFPEFADPFSINLTFSDEGCLKQWSASQAGVGTISSSDPLPAENGYRPILHLKTSDTGQPTLWFFNALTQHPGTVYWKTMIMTVRGINWMGEPLPGYFYDAAQVSYPGDPQSSSSGFSYELGTWTSTGLLPNLSTRFDPNLDQLGVCTGVPEPSTKAILVMGMGMLVFSNRPIRQRFLPRRK